MYPIQSSVVVCFMVLCAAVFAGCAAGESVDAAPESAPDASSPFAVNADPYPYMPPIVPSGAPSAGRGSGEFPGSDPPDAVAPPPAHSASVPPPATPDAGSVTHTTPTPSSTSTVPDVIPQADASTSDLPPADCLVPLHLVWTGPAVSGFMVLNAWWTSPTKGPRTWGAVTECADTVAGDGQLDCHFSLPCDSSPLEFQIDLPDGRFWGDESCDPTGGCGTTNGTVRLTRPSRTVAFTMVPNPKGAPYYNGHADKVH